MALEIHSLATTELVGTTITNSQGHFNLQVTFDEQYYLQTTTHRFILPGGNISDKVKVELNEPKLDIMLQADTVPG
jgi:hypothetical protein